MKLLAAILSALSVATLAIPYWFNSNEESANDKDLMSALALVKPHTPAKSKNNLEQRWLANQQQVEQQKQQQQRQEQQQQKQKEQAHSVLFEGKALRLFGIFKQAEGYFVLIKTSEGNLVKVGKEQDIEPGIWLKAISQRSVTLASEQSEKEFELFKRRSNETSN
ncbi:hypothetical protein MHM95_09445 [Pseudoalteromonas sp. CnMc7-15]|uniref:hypothetical protein n=1 Tax=unclassified Pseudoalteromonas TaxID=194690 RepID=UPI001EF4911E|nr:hypothetical protein [Pseudoalteromonas sp. CnMc7-15]MCG7566514.1 hypothetical protein [Pseudoalteromonas sp. CnMc7-15]